MSLVIKIIAFLFAAFIIIFSIYFFAYPNQFAEQPKNENHFSPIALGQQAYGSYCASCHGLKGKGDGPSSITLSKLPPNFLSSRAEFVNGFSEAGLEKTIENGIPDSQMPGFHYLSKDVKRNLIVYLRSLRRHSTKNRN